MVVHSRARDHPQEYRHPLYLADWTRSIPYVDDLMAEDDLDEPHIKRKHVILQKYPQIKTLYGPEHRTKYIALLLVAVQLSLAYYFGKVNTNAHPVVYALTVYFVGASITQVFGTIIHEACHNLVANGPVANRVVAFMANIGIPFPIAASFRRYHLEHHAYQGVTGKDPDLPLDWEIRLCRGNPVFKILFLFFYPVMYVIRGLAMQKTPSNWELFNIAWTVTTDLLVYRYCGAGGFMYLFYSLWFGYGIHPGAAHFIQEHFTFVSGQETFSYYGVLNYPFLNIGYHTEHHDFAQVPWTAIRKVREWAPEYYNTLHYHTSWVMCLWNFVFDKNMGPQSRVGRTHEAHKRGRKLAIPVDKDVPEKAAGMGERVDSGIMASE